jgi:methyltransferase (TIGR00027 family)
MQSGEYSKTAMGTAFMRAYHAAHVRPPIFEDLLAQRLLTAEEILAAEERHLRALQVFHPAEAAAYPQRDEALACWMAIAGAPAIVLARARYAEDLLEQAVNQGIRQYVILGAGMDSFAWRRPDLLARLQVFEIDHPATQAHKRQRLREVGLEPPPGLNFLPVDFGEDNLAAALGRAPDYDPEVPTFFSWLGVTYYLPREALDSTWSAITAVAPPGSGVIFDYLDTDAFVPEKVSRRVQIMIEIVNRVGEPMITGLAPAALAADLARLGLRLQENLSPAAIQERFFRERTDGYQACEHAHFAWAVVA